MSTSATLPRVHVTAKQFGSEQSRQPVGRSNEDMHGEFSQAGTYAALYSSQSPTGVFFRARVREVGGLIREFGSGGTILDIGCGPGIIARELRGQYSGYVGLDISPSMVQECRHMNADDLNVHAIIASAEDLPFPGRLFDIVLCLGVLEYLRDVGMALHEVARVLRDDGFVIVSMLNAVSPCERWRQRTRAREHGSKLPVRLYGRHEMCRCLEAKGLHVQAVKYFDFNVFPPPLDHRYPRWQARTERLLARLYLPGLHWLGSGFLLAARKFIPRN